MNVVDDVTSDLHMMLLVEGRLINEGYVYFGGTYQHATSEVTLAQSQNYTISSAGLGGVLKYNASINSRYDGMQGVSGNFKGTNICVASLEC